MLRLRSMVNLRQPGLTGCQARLPEVYDDPLLLRALDALRRARLDPLTGRRVDVRVARDEAQGLLEMPLCPRLVLHLAEHLRQRVVRSRRGRIELDAQRRQL